MENGVTTNKDQFKNEKKNPLEYFMLHYAKTRKYLLESFFLLKIKKTKDVSA